MTRNYIKRLLVFSYSGHPISSIRILNNKKRVIIFCILFICNHQCSFHDCLRLFDNQPIKKSFGFEENSEILVLTSRDFWKLIHPNDSVNYRTNSSLTEQSWKNKADKEFFPSQAFQSSIKGSDFCSL